jgi:hypothetical protein
MRSYLTAGAGAGVRRLRFSVARGLDLVSGEQNIALGTEFNAVIGRSLTTFGSGPASSFARIDGFAADTAGPLLAQFALRAEASHADSPIRDGARWHDLAASARVLLYVADRSGGPLTLVTGGRLEARTRSTNPWQGTLGGEHGLRGYRIDEIATGSNVSAFVEQRVNLPVVHPSLDLGFAAFGDAGRGWRGDAPLANDTGWRADLGGAIRVGFPAGTGAIARIETAWPIGPERGRGRAFRVTWSSTALSR